MNRPIVIFDGNNTLFRAYYKFTGMKSRNGSSTSCIYGLPYISRRIINKFDAEKVYMVFDGGKSEFRKNILPEYKKRDPKIGFDIDDFIAQKNVTMELLYYMGCFVVQKPGDEADDWICYLTNKFTRKGKQVVIISADKDFRQLLNENVMIYDPGKDLKITHKNIKRLVGYEANQCVDYLCLDGDSSDKIPGYPGMGEKRCLDFFNKYSSIKEYINSEDKLKLPEKSKLEIIYKRNRQLIDLQYYYRKFTRKEKSTPLLFKEKPIVNNLKVREISIKYNINTFLEPDFLKPFKNLKNG